LVESASIESRVKHVIAEALQIEPSLIGDTFHADDSPYWDSLTHLRLIEKLEDEFSISIPHALFEAILEYKTLVKVVTSEKTSATSLELSDRASNLKE
jgi:acyl carrier protein